MHQHAVQLFQTSVRSALSREQLGYLVIVGRLYSIVLYFTVQVSSTLFNLGESNEDS